MDKKGQVQQFLPICGQIGARGLTPHNHSNPFIINVLQETERAITSAAALVSGLRIDVAGNIKTIKEI